MIATFQENPTQLERILKVLLSRVVPPSLQMAPPCPSPPLCPPSPLLLRGDSRLKRALTILKARGSAHDPSTRQYEITTDGVILGDQFNANQDLT